jgi:hypothetical protein
MGGRDEGAGEGDGDAGRETLGDGPDGFAGMVQPARMAEARIPTKTGVAFA